MYETDEQQLENEQDLMGLYESELNKQLFLRNKQRKEWDMMNKKIEAENHRRQEEGSDQQRLMDQEKREEDRVELTETTASKKLTQAMLRSCQEHDDGNDTLEKVVDVLKDQNGNGMEWFFFKFTNF